MTPVVAVGLALFVGAQVVMMVGWWRYAHRRTNPPGLWWIAWALLLAGLLTLLAGPDTTATTLAIIGAVSAAVVAVGVRQERVDRARLRAETAAVEEWARRAVDEEDWPR